MSCPMVFQIMQSYKGLLRRIFFTCSFCGVKVTAVCRFVTRIFSHVTFVDICLTRANFHNADRKDVR